MTTLRDLRQNYQRRIGAQIVRFSEQQGRSYPNFADGSSQSSVRISNGLSAKLGFSDQHTTRLSGQTAGTLFEKLTCEFVEEAFAAIRHLRPGRWQYLTVQTQISGFVQYRHLEMLDSFVNDNPSLSAALGHGYIVTPDIIIARSAATLEEVNAHQALLDDSGAAVLTPFLERNQSTPFPFMHASVSCKWTIRSDRSQNTRTEALNLIRNRKGHLPHIVAVTAEPLPTRIASLALGTGDLDCVYHFALGELREVCETLPGCEDQSEMLSTMIEGNRLCDVSDLPFDLAV